MEWDMYLPPWAARETAGILQDAREVRFRPGQPVQALLQKKLWQGKQRLTHEEVTRIAQALSGHALAGYGWQLADGFVPLPGGHRMGVSGRMTLEGGAQLRDVGSVCVRIAHEIKGVADALMPRLGGQNVLIIGAPGMGKTTLLRDMVRSLSYASQSVGVADERGEIAACVHGVPQLDVGPCTDVVYDCDKARAMRMLLRGMAPTVLATDELGRPQDVGAVLDTVRCGVRVIATAHGEDAGTVFSRPMLRPLQDVFDVLVLLPGFMQPPKVIYKRGKDACI